MIGRKKVLRVLLGGVLGGFFAGCLGYSISLSRPHDSFIFTDEGIAFLALVAAMPIGVVPGVAIGLVFSGFHRPWVYALAIAGSIGGVLGIAAPVYGFQILACSYVFGLCGGMIYQKRNPPLSTWSFDALSIQNQWKVRISIVLLTVAASVHVFGGNISSWIDDLSRKRQEEKARKIKKNKRQADARLLEAGQSKSARDFGIYPGSEVSPNGKFATTADPPEQVVAWFCDHLKTLGLAFEVTKNDSTIYFETNGRNVTRRGYIVTIRGSDFIEQVNISEGWGVDGRATGIIY